MRNKTNLRNFPFEKFFIIFVVVIGHICLCMGIGSKHMSDEKLQNKYLSVLNIPPDYSPAKVVQKEQRKATVNKTLRQKTSTYSKNINLVSIYPNEDGTKHDAVSSLTPEIRAVQTPFDLEAVRNQALVNEKERAKSIDEKTKEVQEIQSSKEATLAKNINDAVRKDCQTAYANGEHFRGGFALLPLIYGSITNKCKWR